MGVLGAVALGSGRGGGGSLVGHKTYIQDLYSEWRDISKFPSLPGRSPSTRVQALSLKITIHAGPQLQSHARVTSPISGFDIVFIRIGSVG